MWPLARRVLPVLFLLVVACSSPRSEGDYEGLGVDRPTTMPSVVLHDTEGQPFDVVADTEGDVRLVYFGYTNCPDVCPIHLSQLRDVLSRPGIPGNVSVIFVTVDPVRDTPEVIREYLDQFDTEFVGLTGTEEELIEAQESFGSIVAVRENDDENYTMGHDGRVFAFAPDGWGYTQYPHPTRQSSWVHDLPILAALEAAA
ncbi:MAG: SCO family protein [Actinomycetota bacterium]|nr:SCO family protein [Actinomycetota bacterium]